MSKSFDTIVRKAILRGVAIHSVQATSFGDAHNRAQMLRACLKLVVATYPGLRLQIAACSADLITFDLKGGKDLHLEGIRIPVREANNRTPGTMQITFRALED